MLSVLFIVKWGIVGVAIATLIARLIDVVFSSIALHKKIHSWLIDLRVVVKSSIACLLMYCVVFFSAPLFSNIILLILIGTFVYFLSLILLLEANLIGLLVLIKKNVFSSKPVD